jgi:hypothetical protein
LIHLHCWRTGWPGHEPTQVQHQVSGLQGDCDKLAELVTAAFTALAAAAGDAGVESAASSAGVSALKQFLNMASGYQHTAQGLDTSATTYARAETEATAAVTGIGPGGAG